MIRTRLQTFSTTSSTGELYRMVFPADAKAAIRSLIMMDAFTSSPERGSSSRMRSGSWRSAAAMRIFWRMPLEYVSRRHGFRVGPFSWLQRIRRAGTGREELLILDRGRWRYRKSLSDLSGRDIQGHGGNPEHAIVAVRNWLATESQLADRPGGSFIIRQYKRFRKELPNLCRRARLRVSELSFKDYCALVAVWLRANA